ncbi:MAG TPA: succinate dehydrogenase, hydrophobic membrane anchor protein [Burkholderiales bacterium]|nr:succinate dehydrogenase, hydrophobic membrane anchor protein [Burkholderiales bacterium]
MVKRLVVGAHYGLRPWLAQRITALVMALLTAAALLLIASRSPFTHESWSALFDRGWMRIGTLLFVVSLAWHAWVGARDILMDYIKPDGLRLALQVATLLLLAGYLGWAVEILWR